MLKLSRVKWKCKCPKHPKYNPETGGEAAIVGACGNCQLLFEIYRAHRRMTDLMRRAKPEPEKQKPEPDDRQMSFEVMV